MLKDSGYLQILATDRKNRQSFLLMTLALLGMAVIVFMLGSPATPLRIIMTSLGCISATSLMTALTAFGYHLILRQEEMIYKHKYAREKERENMNISTQQRLRQASHPKVSQKSGPLFHKKSEKKAALHSHKFIENNVSHLQGKK